MDPLHKTTIPETFLSRLAGLENPAYRGISKMKFINLPMGYESLRLTQGGLAHDRLTPNTLFHNENGITNRSEVMRCFLSDFYLNILGSNSPEIREIESTGSCARLPCS